MPKASERALQLAREVLAKIAAYDPYFPKPNDVMLMAWAEHISLKNPDRDDMLEAVSKFYETNTDVKPMPASITSLARQIKQDRTMRHEYVPPPNKSADPEPEQPLGVKKISLQEWEELHARKFPELALGKPLEDDDANPLRVHCTHCNSAPGSPCVIPGTTQLLTKIRAHPCRIEAATEAASETGQIKI